MDLDLENMTNDELKGYLKKYDLVDGISKLNKNGLINTLKSIIEYKANKQTDYHIFKFGEKMIKLSDEQYNVVVADIKQNIRIIASAGSGKTTTIICRIKYLIDHGIDPERIMLTTFSVDAAKTLRNKLLDVFGFMPKITVGTIDSIACRYYHRYFKQPYHISISEYTSCFLKYLHSESDIFGDTFDYIFFDEFQDISEIQFQILNYFYKKGTNICAIGDDAQTIYAFRGSNIKYILNLERHFHNLKTFKLVNNYRSSPEIINLANNSIKFNKDQIHKEMIPNNESIGVLPQVRYFKIDKLQNQDIIHKILEHHKNGIPFDDIAIICRNNMPLQTLEADIEKYNKDAIKVNDKLIIKYVALITNHNIDTKPKIKQDHITLTTIHKAKGLEWKVVFMIGCTDSQFPSETNNIGIQEERRLFYVGVTRAKQYLYFYFSKYKNNKREIKQTPKITRFIQELDTTTYDFVNGNKKFFSYNDTRGVKWPTGVAETLRLLTNYDIEAMRNSGIIPCYETEIKNIHGKHQFNAFITSYYLQTDFGEFVDRYITRTIGHKNNESNGLIDIATIILSLNTIFTRKEVDIYKKYKINFSINLSKIKTDTLEHEYIILLSENDFNSTMIKTVEIADNDIIFSIVNKLLIMTKKYNIDMHIACECLSAKNEIPFWAKTIMINSYKKYTDAKNESRNILHDIYNVSLCNTILHGRRRLLYKDVFCEMCDDYGELFDDINGYVDTITNENKNVICKKMFASSEYDIIGEPDLICVDNSTIADFKCSSADIFQLEWMLQLLAYVAIIRTTSPDIAIQFIEVYNPIQGTVYTIDVSDWTKENEYLQYLHQIRVRQLNRNINIDSDDEYIDDDRFVSEFCNSSTIECSEPEYNIVDENQLYDLRETFGESCKDYIEYISKNKKNDELIKFEHIINKIEEASNMRYMVVDTETTGLIKTSFGNYPDYTNSKEYDCSRMIQICWAVYDNNGYLEEIENYYIKSKSFEVTNTEIHGITQEKLINDGVLISNVFNKFKKSLKKVKYIIGHNILFDYYIILSELHRINFNQTIDMMKTKTLVCTMKKSIPLKVNGTFNYVNLMKLYKFLFNEEFEGQHNAKYDVIATNRILRELINKKLVTL